jgi:hypothetical protein
LELVLALPTDSIPRFSLVGSADGFHCVFPLFVGVRRLILSSTPVNSLLTHLAWGFSCTDVVLRFLCYVEVRTNGVLLPH